MPHPCLIFSQSGYLIQIVAIDLHPWWPTVQIQISWLLQKPTDLDLHCLQNRVHPGSAGQGLKKSWNCSNRKSKMAAILKICYFASSPEPKGQLTWNLVEGIRVICRSKIAKIVMIGNPRWPPWQLSWKSMFPFYSWTKRPIDLKLRRKHQGDL